jgi:hypothetical protein
MPRMSTVRAATTIGIDMGKNTLWSASIRWVPSYGESGSRAGASRQGLGTPCLIGIEAGMATPRFQAAAAGGPCAAGPLEDDHLRGISFMPLHSRLTLVL